MGLRLQLAKKQKANLNEAKESIREEHTRSSRLTSFFSMLKKIDHIGIAVHSIAQARLFYEQALGLHCERIEEVPSQQVRTAFFALGETKIELLEPLGEDGPIAKFLQRQGEGVHHIAYSCDDAATQLKQAAEAGCRLINETPISGAGGKQIGFLHPKSTHGVLTELCSAQQATE